MPPRNLMYWLIVAVLVIVLAILLINYVDINVKK